MSKSEALSLEDGGRLSCAQDQKPKLTYVYSRNLFRYVTIMPELRVICCRTTLSYPPGNSGWLVLALREFVSQHRPEGNCHQLSLKLNQEYVPPRQMQDVQK
jgi:hypothetical protein